MKRLSLLLLLVPLLATSVQAQDPNFSQFYFNPLYLNPAFAGSAGGPRIAANYRNQWPSLPGAFVTYAASYDQHFDALSGGVGARAMYDRAGDGQLSTSSFSLQYSYQGRISRTFTVKAGLEATLMQKSIDFSKLRFGDQIDPRAGFVNPTQETLDGQRLSEVGNWNGDPYPDISAGILAFSKKYYFGLALHHLTQPSQSILGNAESILPLKLTGHFGMRIPISGTGSRGDETTISPNIMIQRQGEFMQYNIGAYYLAQNFMIGAMFRQTNQNSDAIIAMIGVKKDALRVAYSYDLTVSDARSSVVGSHEISLIVELPQKNRSIQREFRSIPCPDSW